MSYVDDLLPECRGLIQCLLAPGDVSRYARICRTTLAEVTRAHLLPSQALRQQWRQMLRNADDIRAYEILRAFVATLVSCGITGGRFAINHFNELVFRAHISSRQSLEIIQTNGKYCARVWGIHGKENEFGIARSTLDQVITVEYGRQFPITIDCAHCLS